MNHVHSSYAIVMTLEKQEKHIESEMRAIIESNEIGVVKEILFRLFYVLSHFFFFLGKSRWEKSLMTAPMT